MKKVFVSGCFDMLHSGHVAFLQEAATHGQLYVGIGSDKTIQDLKGRITINSEQERLYMMRALKVVHQAWINTGSGLMDFAEDVRRLQPDIFFVNQDGDTPTKRAFCRELGIEYKVAQRIPHGTLPARSTTALRKECKIPYRIDLAGGWLDQPYVSKYAAGAVLTISVQPDYDFLDRSGMSTSTRNKAIELWHTDIPHGDQEQLAKTLFCFENPPGTKTISGSQDALGIVLPGLNRLLYDGDYWPAKIDSMLDEQTLNWIEEHIYLIPLSPRKQDYDVLANTDICREKVQALAEASERCWAAIKAQNAEAFGAAMYDSYQTQLAMFPNMASAELRAIIAKETQHSLGYKITGAGGGGYIVCVVENPAERNGLTIRIRRN